MVEIFRTNVNNDLDAHQIMDKVKSVYEDADVSFDLDDCDRVFRFFYPLFTSEVKENICEIFTKMGCFALYIEEDLTQINLPNINPLLHQKNVINTFLGFF